MNTATGEPGFGWLVWLLGRGKGGGGGGGWPCSVLVTFYVSMC